MEIGPEETPDMGTKIRVLAGHMPVIPHETRGIGVAGGSDALVERPAHRIGFAEERRNTELTGSVDRLPPHRDEAAGKQFPAASSSAQQHSPHGFRPDPSYDIVIRSYQRDFQWLRYCLESIGRYCTGFRSVVVIIPPASLAKWRWLGLSADRVLCCPAYRDDYLGQQVTKLHADRYSDADFICHVDSDCVFERSTTPGDLTCEGRPYVLMEPYARLDRHIPWRALTERFLGEDVGHEFMRRPPYTFPRWLYPALRKRSRELHGMSLEEYVMSRPPRGFSEFNALGAYAYRHHRDAFHWIDVAHDAAPPPPCHVFWSRQNLDASIRAEIRRLIDAPATPHSGR
ncbi:hypothetical protein [Actinomadura chokoriensis]|uniref:Glycosyltransferase family 2 protein n=1 Tax=Actinomadura chokoriensis TaxID=454156 RepID=A0ABV4R3K4_9ACTN